MGYNTRYSLELPNGETHIIPDVLAKISYSAFNESGRCTDSCTWYKHEEEMIQVSKYISNTLFKLIGKGEDSNDLWHKYFKDGKMQECRAEISYPPFDESKLV